MHVLLASVPFVFAHCVTAMRVLLSCDIQLAFAESKLFCDDSRLSKLVRRVTREDDRDRRITAIRQLREFLLVVENAKVCQGTSSLI